MPRYDIEVLMVAKKTITAANMEQAESRAKAYFSKKGEGTPPGPVLRSITEAKVESLRT